MLTKEKLELRQYRYKTKCIVLSYYGRGCCKCVKCGFDDIRALSIDHINGGGCQHRLKVKSNYSWFIVNHFPKGYQTLCMNCQIIKKIDNKENKYELNFNKRTNSDDRQLNLFIS